MVMVEPIKKKLEVILHRCSCAHCDTAERELGRLSKKYSISLSVRRVEDEPGRKEWAGWKTPIVEVNGRMVTQYEFNLRKWEEAVQQAGTVK